VLALAAGIALSVPPLLAQQSPQHSMRDRMREMMRGHVPPPGMSPEALHEPTSAGAQLVARFCAQCHDLPSPRFKTAPQWPPVLERMLAHMEHMRGGMMGMAPVSVPELAQVNTLLAYLQAYAMRPATPEELASGPQAQRAVFVVTCSQCHTLPSPRLHPPDAWPGIEARMRAHIRHVGLAELTPQTQEQILRFVQTVAATPSPSER
jgi:mono/diheme cytochrome c family protein